MKTYNKGFGKRTAWNEVLLEKTFARISRKFPVLHGM